MKSKSEIRFRERFEEFSVKPSPEIWKNIEAANPVPVAKPSWKRYFWQGAAAIVVVSSLLWLLPKSEFNTPDSGSLVSGQSDLPHTAVSHSENTAGQNTDTESFTENRPESAGNITGSDSNPKPASSTPSTLSATTPTPVTGTQQVQSTQPRTVTPVQTAAENLTKPAADPKPTPRIPDRSPAKIEGSDPVNDSTGSSHSQKLEVFIPNAFAPLSAGQNNIFRPVIKNNAPVKEYKMQIFSRTGMLLFESEDIESGWDGRFDGDIVHDQVCVYTVSFRDELGFPYVRKGTITIIR